METVNSFKGYGKVDEREELAFRQQTRRRFIIITISAIILLAVIVGVVIGVVVRNNDDDGSPSNKSTQTSTAQSIKAVCSVTQYPASCMSSLTAANPSGKLGPEGLFKLSMEVAVNELSKLSAIPDQLMSKTNNPQVKAALRICKDLFEDSVDQLNSSLSTLGAGESSLSKFKLDDLKTWISTVITNQETCLDSLDESEKAGLLDEMKKLMENSTEFSSNSLAIVTKVVSVLDNLPIHRKLLGANTVSDFPTWVHSGDRRLLQEEMPKPDIVVARDGTGNYKTIKEAVGAIAIKNKTRTVVYVKAGKYAENVVLDKAHWNIMMYGDGMTKTIVSGTLNFIDGTPTFTTATFIAAGRGFIAKDMGFENTAGPSKHQAVALRSGSDQSVFYRCLFDGYQDTLYAHSNRQFYRSCQITGTVDFIFGNAAVVFQDCTIQPRQPDPNQFITITAQGKKDPNQNTGISIHRSTIVPLGTVTAQTYLGRPWKDYSTTIIMGTQISPINPAGWIPFNLTTGPPKNIFYAEYKNTGPGSVVDKRVNWTGYYPVLTMEKASQFTVEPFIQGSQWLPQASVTFDGSL